MSRRIQSPLKKVSACAIPTNYVKLFKTKYQQNRSESGVRSLSISEIRGHTRAGRNLKLPTHLLGTKKTLNPTTLRIMFAITFQNQAPLRDLKLDCE